MDKAVKIAVITIAIFSIVTIAVFGTLRFQKSYESKQQAYQQSIGTAIKKEFARYQIENQEAYEDFRKVTLNVNNGDNLTTPTPGGKAVMFFKNGQRQNIPENYLKNIIGQNKTNPDDKILSVQYYEYFNKFDPHNAYSKVYLGQVELTQPAREGTSQLLGGPLTYQFFLFDQYGNLFSKNFGTAPIE